MLVQNCPIIIFFKNSYFLRKKLLIAVLLFLAAIQLPAQIGISTNEPTNLTTCGTEQLFEINIINLGNTPLNAVNFTVDFPAGIIYEAGSIAGLNVSESDINDLNQPIFSLPNLSPNNNLAITLLAKATCATTSNLSDFFNTITVVHSSGMQSMVSSPYNVIVPSISITNTVNDFVTGNVGDVFSRSFTIANFGIGAVSELFFQDVHPAGIQITGASFGTLNLNGNTATVTLSATDFAQIGNGNEFFEFGESITLTEDFFLQDCNDGLSEVSVGWGCAGEICENFIAFAEVNIEKESPFLVWSYGATALAEVCNPGSLEIIIVNQVNENFPGAASAINLQLNPGLGAPDVPNELLRIECFDLANFSIGGDTLVFDTVNYSGYGLDLSQITTDPDGAGGLQDLDYDGQFDDLAAGDTLRLFLNAGLNPDC